MKLSVKSLSGYKMGATDGMLGKVKEFYFDDQTWTIRYLIVETGNWLNHHKVLISPLALLKPDFKNKVFPISLSKKQIKNSLTINIKETISGQKEIILNNHYPWMDYWDDIIGTSAVIVKTAGSLANILSQVKAPVVDTQLRRTHNVPGCSIHAVDGDIGNVEDLLIEDSNWKIDFIVADTGNSFQKKKVLISVKCIKKIEWNTANVVTQVSIKYIKNSPEFYSS